MLSSVTVPVLFTHHFRTIDEATGVLSTRLVEIYKDDEPDALTALVRILSTLVRDKQIGKRVVPIVPDESRTFGMEGMFRQIGIYNPSGEKVGRVSPFGPQR